jgi:GH15 family glucan-1,4-alpha-glucosidase
VSSQNHRFPPIGSYGFLSDCHTAALVSFNGSVEWLCCPRFDSPSAFAALLDRGAGHMSLRPKGVIVPISRRYSPGTLVIETTWVTDSGWVVVKDALTIADWAAAGDGGDRTGRPQTAHESDRSLLRTITCIDGEVEMEMECLPRFAYGAEGARWSGGELGEAVATAADGTELLLTSDMELEIGDGGARGGVHLREDETAFCALTWSDGDLGGPRSAPEALERIDSTEEFWREWLRDGDFPDHPWRIHLQRSALVLKGLTYAPTGAIVAAPTTSLPETPGGERNWDYRYSWIRDSTFSLWALHTLGFDQEARDFMRFIVDVCQDHPDLQIMYGVGHERDLEERTLDHLSGYGGARPVRIGNGAFDQRQNDVWGSLLDSIYVHEKALRGRGTQATRELIRYQVEAAIEAWPHPDQGIWESRGEPQHYVSSKLMIWVAVDRGARLARIGGFDALAEEWQAKADEFKAEILERGVRDGVFRQHYETDGLAAADPAVPLPAPRRPAGARHRQRDRLRPQRERARLPLQGGRDRRRPAGRGGDVPDLLLLARLGALGDRRAAPRPRALRTAAGGGRLARPLRRGARRRLRPAPRQLPPGLHPPGPDQRRLPRDRRRAARRRRLHGGLHRDGRGPRGRLSLAPPG